MIAASGSTEGGGLRWAWLAAACATLAALAFARGVDGEFIFDDYVFLRFGCWQIERVGDLLAVPFEGACRYRRLRYLSLAIDHLLWARDPRGYKLTNLVLHAASSALVWAIAWRVLLATPPRRRAAASTVAALLWCLHPVHVDAVTYVSGRRDLLMGLFFFAAFLAAPSSLATARDRLRVALAAALWAASVGSKEMGVTLPLVAAALAAARTRGDWRPTRGSVAAVVAAGAVAAAAAATALANALSTHSVHVDLMGGAWSTHLATMPALAAQYASMVVMPVDLWGDYDAFAPVTEASDVRMWTGLLVIAGYAAALWAAWSRRARVVWFGLAWFAVTMLPVAQIYPHHERIAEHYLYVPLVGIALVVAGAAASVALPGGRVVLGAGALVAGVLATATQWRIDDYRTRASFALAVLERSPNSLRARGLLVDALQAEGRARDAIAVAEEAATLAPTASVAWGETQLQLAKLHADAGDIDDAAAAARRVLTVFPTQPEALAILGTVAMRQGRSDEGLAMLRAAADARPSPNNLRNLAVALARSGALAEADAVFARVVDLTPADASLWTQWGEVAFRARDAATALQRFERAIALAPTDNVARSRLVQLYTMLGRTAEATAHRNLLPARAGEAPEPGDITVPAPAAAPGAPPKPGGSPDTAGPAGEPSTPPQ